jgi:hypothetical protein
MRAWARKKKGIEIYSIFEVLDDKDQIKLTPRQQADAENIRKTIPKETDPDDKLFWEFKREQSQETIHEFKKIVPVPGNGKRLIGFADALKNNTLALAEKQHKAVMELDENDLISTTYFAAMALFKDWRKCVCVRDVYFNMTGENSGEKKTAAYFEYAGNAVPVESLIKLIGNENI